MNLIVQKLINEHLNKIETSLKKAPFWKYATIATVCIEQEYMKQILTMMKRCKKEKQCLVGLR